MHKILIDGKIAREAGIRPYFFEKDFGLEKVSTQESIQRLEDQVVLAKAVGNSIRVKLLKKVIKRIQGLKNS